MNPKQTALALGAFLVFFFASVVHADIEYTLVDLRVLSGDVVGDIHPYNLGGINESGQIIGYGYLVQDHITGDDATAHPFFYEPVTGSFVNLGDIDGNMGESGNGGNAYEISDNGWVVGRNTTDVEPAGYRAFYWKDLNGNGVTDPGEMNNLGTDPEYQYSYAWGVNNTGQVVGRDVNFETDIETGWLWTDHNGNHVSDPGEKTLLPNVTPNAVNDAGQIVGSFPDGGGRWTDANANGAIDAGEVAIVPNDLNMLKPATAEEINAGGQVAGVLTNGYGKKQGYLWTDGDQDNEVDGEEIALFGEALQNTFVRDLNDAGEIVGGSYHWRYQPDKGSSRRAYIWDAENGIRDLNEMVAEYSIEGYGPFILTQAEGINNSGQIVASGWFDNDGNGSRGSREPEHVCLLTPRLPGDLNLDGIVSSADLDIVRANWGTQVEPGSLSEGDASGDGEVNSQDLDLVRSSWGLGSQPQAIPEPSVLVLGLMLGLIGFGRKRAQVR